MNPSDYLNGLLEAHRRGELEPLLYDAYHETLTLMRDEYLPAYAAIATIAVTVELLLVGVLLWWAWRTDRMTDKWRRRLLAALPVAVLFGLVRLALSPSWVGVLWLACVGAAWWLVFRHVPVPEPMKEPAA